MRKLAIGIVLLGACWLGAAEDDKRQPAEEVIQRYLAMPFAEDHPFGEGREARLKVLDQLKPLGDDAVRAIDKTLPAIKSPGQRAELVETLQRMPSKASADLFVKVLQDKDKRIRSAAVYGLRLMSRKTDRIGSQRKLRGSLTPAVPGLEPHLIVAADDPDETNRWSALFSLADTLDPAAIEAIRKHLKDPSSKVRLLAACLLTEFNDTSGLSEMKQALAQFCAGERKGVTLHSELIMLLASFERITGKTFGPIPDDPNLSSNLDRAEAARKQIKTLLKTWSTWWAWEPAPSEK